MTCQIEFQINCHNENFACLMSEHVYVLHMPQKIMLEIRNFCGTPVFFRAPEGQRSEIRPQFAPMLEDDGWHVTWHPRVGTVPIGSFALV